jgi:hypothetical protein
MSSGVAGAQHGSQRPVHATLVWERGPGAEACISGARLSRAIEQQLGYELFEVAAREGAHVPHAEELEVRGRIVREEPPARFRADVELRDGRGQLLGRRAVEAPGSDCQALDEALVLVVALALDAQVAALASAASAAPAEPPPSAPEPVVEPTPAPPAPAPPPPAAPAPPPPSPPEPEEAPRPRSPRVIGRTPRAGSSYGLLLSAGAGAAAGLLPDVTLQAALTVGMRTPRGFGLELSAAILPSGQRPTDAGDAEFRAGYAELRGCAPLRQGEFAIDACLGIYNGVMRARGVGFRYGSFSRLVPIAGGQALLRASYTFGPRLFARAAAALGTPFLRDTFVAEGDNGRRVELHRASALTWNAGLELGIQLR